ncbi:type-F conjugative transfer system protein TraW [Orientia tsutsugamushi]|uniref:Type-F conjugative transfer system protein TraW n=1 Tax=Orientia tsutsugamushi TaxID=784 RepID=A0A2R8F4C3_ORITS|nr:conjugal transfer protein [Orientia tsutsugamushi]SPM46044.1 type-F conjugative transfer system protein TraW [Orientia tsutsugamushi]
MKHGVVIVIGTFFALFAVAYQVSDIRANLLNADIGVEIKDYGTRGHVFPIIEESLLDVIMAKLNAASKSGLLNQMQLEFQEKVRQKIMRPVPVKNLSKATENTTRIYDSTYVQKDDIKTKNGIIIVKGGTKINPLEMINWGEPLILIDGDDKDQVSWAKSRSGKIVLVNGNPIELSNLLGRHVFFDQLGFLSMKFKIQAVPAIIEQENTVLKISEISTP